MDYKIVITTDAEEDLDRYIQYLLHEKKSDQAAKNVLDDFEATMKALSKTAGIIKLAKTLLLRRRAIDG